MRYINDCSICNGWKSEIAAQLFNNNINGKQSLNWACFLSICVLLSTWTFATIFTRKSFILFLFSFSIVYFLHECMWDVGIFCSVLSRVAMKFIQSQATFNFLNFCRIINIVAYFFLFSGLYSVSLTNASISLRSLVCPFFLIVILFFWTDITKYCCVCEYMH